MSVLQTRSNFIFTVLRAPRAHVISQFLECRYDKWGIKVTKQTAFPREGTDPADFKLWLKHFAQGWEPSMGDFNCYNPTNMQARDSRDSRGAWR